MPICAVAAPVAGQVTDADLERARQRFTQVTAENVGLQVDLARQKRRRQRCSASLSSLELFQSTRQTLDHTFGRNGGLLVAATLGPALLVLLASPFSPSAFGYLLIILIGITFGRPGLLAFLFLSGGRSAGGGHSAGGRTAQGGDGRFRAIGRRGSLAARTSHGGSRPNTTGSKRRWPADCIGCALAAGRK